MSYFGDLMDTEDNRMNGDWDLEDDSKLFAIPAVKDLSLKVKSGGGDLSLSQGIDLVNSDKGLKQKHKTELKYKHSCEHDLKVTATTNDLKLECNYAPSNDSGTETTLECEGKLIPKDGEWESKAEVKFGGYELGPIKGWSELQVDVNKNKQDNGKLAINQHLTYSQSLNHGDFWFGAKAEASKGEKNFQMDGVYGILKYQSGDNAAWMRASILRKFMGAGFSHKLNDRTNLSTEFNYDMASTGKHTGVFGTPLFWRYGADVTFPSKTIVSAQLAAADGSCILTHKTATPLSATTKFTATAQYDIQKMCTDIKSTKSKLGFALEFKA